MSEQPVRPAARRRVVAWATWAAVRTVIGRLWALVLIAVVLWLSYRAVKYLFMALVVPPPAPPQIVDIPRRTAGAVRPPPAPAFAGITAVENPRAPLSHYHHLETWFQPDRFNGCTRSGCHAPLPHGKDKASRAFLNLHATSLHCGVCHLVSDQVPLPLTWYDLKSGRPTATPALLPAYAWLTEKAENPPAEYTAAEQQLIVGLLRTAARQAAGDYALTHLAEHLAAVRADSEDFPGLVKAAAESVPRHFRGEYGAKLALRDARGRPRLDHPDSEAASEEYRRRKEGLSPAEREALLARVHPARRRPTLVCTDCHQSQTPLVDLEQVGYPAARIRQLAGPLITRAIEHMMQGRDFHMPTFLAPSAPAAAPTGKE